MELTGECTFILGNQENEHGHYFENSCKKELMPIELPLQTMEHFLAASFPWGELKTAEVETPNLAVLKNVKERLNRLIPLHKNESSVSSKTKELLNLTSSLLKKKEEDLLVPTTVFVTPSNNDCLEYAVMIVTIALLIIFIVKIQKRERRINEEIVDSLKRAVEAKVKELKWREEV